MSKDIWEALAERFPEHEVKSRPGAARWEHKPSCEKDRCRETKDPSKHHQFSYVDARAVAQRLDDVLTPGGWQFTCSVIPGSDIVKGHLEITVDPSQVYVREDHGYPNSDRDEEPVKAATSDALKRCAVLFGVGRHLYEDNGPHTTHAAPVAPSRPAAPAPRPPSSPAVGGAPEEPEWVAAQLGTPDALQTAPAPVGATESHADGGTCPVHHLAWTLRPAGTSKAGKPYDAFWACPSSEQPYCRQRPDRVWTARQEVA